MSLMLHKSGALTLIPLLTWFAFTAWQWGIADIYAAQAQNHIKSWRKSGKSPDDQEWVRVRNILVKSLGYNPGFPPYLEVLGELNLTQSLNFFLNDTEVGDLRQNALGYFREDVARRPTWPYGWADIALVKLANEESDEEFFHTLERAAALGPWVSKIQRVIAQSGFSVWEDLGQNKKQLIISNLERGIHHQSREMLKIAESFGRQEIVCNMLETELRTKYCRRQ